MNAGSQELPRLDVVIGNNFGHLPMFVGAEKGIFKRHGIDAHMKFVDTGTDMVNAMHNGEAQIGDMSVTTFLKAVHAGEPFKVIGIIMNDATRDKRRRAARDRHPQGRRHRSRQRRRPQGQAHRARARPDVRRILQDGAAPRRHEIRGPDHREHLVAIRPGAGAEGGQGRRGGVVGALCHGGVGAGRRLVLVIRGGHHMSYVMVATAHGPTVTERPGVVRNFAAGLAGASHYTPAITQAPRRSGGDIRQMGSQHRRGGGQEGDPSYHAMIRASRRRSCRRSRRRKTRC